MYRWFGRDKLDDHENRLRQERRWFTFWLSMDANGVILITNVLTDLSGFQEVETSDRSSKCLRGLSLSKSVLSIMQKTK